MQFTKKLKKCIQAVYNEKKKTENKHDREPNNRKITSEKGSKEKKGGNH